MCAELTDFTVQKFFIVVGEIGGRKERREINTTLQVHTSSKNNIVAK